MTLLAPHQSNQPRRIHAAAVALAAAFGAMAFVAPASAGPVGYLQSIGVNVNLADGLGNQDRTVAQWTPSAAGVGYKIEDSVGSSGYVGPGYGGQPYDLEALYVQRTATQLIITGVSGANPGFNPAAGTSSPTCTSPTCSPTYGMGDFFVGSLVGGTFSPQRGIELTGHHFTLDGSGHTTGWSSPLDKGKVVTLSGSVASSGAVSGATGWESGLGVWGGMGAPSQLAAGYTAGSGSYTPAMIEYETLGTGPHYVYQAKLDLTALAGLDFNSMAVRWGEICGNDILEALVPAAVPTPSTLSLMVGLMGLGALVSRRRKA
jgi:hypothetical protein